MSCKESESPLVETPCPNMLHLQKENLNVRRDGFGEGIVYGLNASILSFQALLIKQHSKGTDDDELPLWLQQDWHQPYHAFPPLVGIMIMASCW